jgi:integrase
MARTPKDQAPDLSKPADITAGMIDRLTCPPGKDQAFLRDTKAPGLRVRVTSGGAKSFVFEAKLNRKTIRRTIGDVRAWEIGKARTEANRLRMTLDGGDDPRELDREAAASKIAKGHADVAHKAAAEAAAISNALTVADAWVVYLADRKPYWGDRHHADHERLAKAGGEKAKRGTRGRGKTIAMPLSALMNVPLRLLDTPTIEAWAAKEAQTRPAVARLSWRLLKAFLNWCAEQPNYASLLPGKNPAASRKARESLGRSGVKSDNLGKDQLDAWFSAVRTMKNPIVAAALQTMLLTGARPSEVLSLEWEGLNERWKGITIRDKVEGTRVIPATPYVLSLLRALPKRNKFIFSSSAADKDEEGKPVYKKGITFPRTQHVEACTAAGIEGLTLHGLRRSFASLTEWLDIPAGVVAQIMGHKPSATAEKHYKVRPLDLLRVHHERIEAWILEQGKVPFVPAKDGAALQVVG